MALLILQRFRPEPPLALVRFGPDGRLAALAARADAVPVPVAIAPANDFTGFGGVDYTDTEQGTVVELPAGEWVTVSRTLSASAPNNRLQGAFAGHEFWAGDKVLPLAAYDVLLMNLAVRVRPGTLGGALDVQLLAGSIEVDHRVRALTGAVGEWDSVRVALSAFVRATFAAQGASVRLRCSVAAEFDRFSPEFYPLSRLAT